MKYKKIESKAEIYACKCHEKINHLYDFHPYRYHLKMASDIGERFIHLIPIKDRKNVRAAIWCHDLIEDAHQTYNDIKRNTNEIVAEYTYALTNEKGRNRKDRANDKYYKELKEYKHASFVKLCDRIANIEYSKFIHSSMFDMYKKEYRIFKKKLYDERWNELWEELEKLIKE